LLGENDGLKLGLWEGLKLGLLEGENEGLRLGENDGLKDGLYEDETTVSCVAPVTIPLYISSNDLNAFNISCGFAI
jgi:hypothetical protein